LAEDETDQSDLIGGLQCRSVGIGLSSIVSRNNKMDRFLYENTITEPSVAE